MVDVRMKVGWRARINE